MMNFMKRLSQQSESLAPALGELPALACQVTGAVARRIQAQDRALAKRLQATATSSAVYGPLQAHATRRLLQHDSGARGLVAQQRGPTASTYGPRDRLVLVATPCPPPHTVSPAHCPLLTLAHRLPPDQLATRFVPPLLNAAEGMDNAAEGMDNATEFMDNATEFMNNGTTVSPLPNATTSIDMGAIDHSGPVVPCPYDASAPAPLSYDAVARTSASPYHLIVRWWTHQVVFVCPAEPEHAVVATDRALELIASIRRGDVVCVSSYDAARGVLHSSAFVPATLPLPAHFDAALLVERRVFTGRDNDGHAVGTPQRLPLSHRLRALFARRS